MPCNDHRVVVVMPAYNAEKTLVQTYEDIPKDIVDEIILVDDSSSDDTIEVAKQLNIHVFVHAQNRGYGGNQKTCYTEALKLDPDIVVMLHPDYQYDPKLIPEMIEPIVKGEADLVLGSRLRDGKALEGGMPLYKFISNRILTTIENLALGLNCSELHTGYRAYSAELLRTIPFMNNSENFVFDTEVIVQTVAFGFRIAEIGVPAKYMDDASSIRFWPSVVYGVQTLWAVARFLGFRLGIPSRIFEGLDPWWKKPKRTDAQ